VPSVSEMELFAVGPGQFARVFKHHTLQVDAMREAGGLVLACF